MHWRPLAFTHPVILQSIFDKYGMSDMHQACHTSLMV